MFPANCKVVHVVCVFPAEEIRVRLLMFFKSEALTLEEGKEQERVQPLSKGFAERVLTARVVFPTPVGADAAPVAVLVESVVLLALTGEEEAPVPLGGWVQTAVVTGITKVLCRSPLKSCILGQDLAPWCTLVSVAEEVEEMLVVQGTVFFNDCGLSCPLLFSEVF